MSKYNTISNFLFNNTTPVLLPVVCLAHDEGCRGFTIIVLKWFFIYYVYIYYFCCTVCNLYTITALGIK
jgi:hypothetical protein